MRIEFQPKPDGMQHVNMLFREESPDPEDHWVREQLEGYPAPPKRVLRWEREGHPYEVWQYGECVIGDALFVIERFKSVADRARAICRAEVEQAAVTPSDLHRVIAETAMEFHESARYRIEGTGPMTLSVDEAGLRGRLLERLASARLSVGNPENRN